MIQATTGIKTQACFHVGDTAERLIAAIELAHYNHRSGVMNRQCPASTMHEGKISLHTQAYQTVVCIVG